jgi:RimJ/RimL family protein N-acetyltransferase
LDGRLVKMGIDPDNDVCLALANRLGFSPLPTLEEQGYFPGTREGRRLQFGMTRERWARQEF